MQEIGNDRQKIWFDECRLTIDPQDCFDIEYWRQINAIIGSAQGRGTTWFVADDQQEMALRHYYRGGLLGKVVRDSYWFTGWEKTRSYAEFQLLKKLREGGVNVPRPIAARAIRDTFVYQADILVEKIVNSQDLVAILKDRALPLELWAKIGHMIRKMHDLQVCHTDLNAHNILLDEHSCAWLIDFDKCYLHEGNAWKKDNLQRLQRSFQKEYGKHAINWTQDDWQALCDGYKHTD